MFETFIVAFMCFRLFHKINDAASAGYIMTFDLLVLNLILYTQHGRVKYSVKSEWHVKSKLLQFKVLRIFTHSCSMNHVRLHQLNEVNQHRIIFFVQRFLTFQIHFIHHFYYSVLVCNLLYYKIMLQCQQRNNYSFNDY